MQQSQGEKMKPAKPRWLNFTSLCQGTPGRSPFDAGQLGPCCGYGKHYFKSHISMICRKGGRNCGLTILKGRQIKGNTEKDMFRNKDILGPGYEFQFALKWFNRGESALRDNVDCDVTRKMRRSEYQLGFPLGFSKSLRPVWLGWLVVSQHLKRKSNVATDILPPLPHSLLKYSVF